MESAASPGTVTALWAGIVVLVAGAAGGGLWWWLRQRRRRVAHYLFTPLPCSFHPATFDAPKSLFDVAWDIGLSDAGLHALQQLRLLPRQGRLDYADLNRTLGYYVEQLGGYRQFVYRCQALLSDQPQDATAAPEAFERAGEAMITYIGEEERRLERYVGNPTGLLQNRMVAYLYDNAKTAHARKVGLALAFDYQSFQLLNRCIARDMARTQELLAYTASTQHDKGVRGAQIKAVASGGGVALLETAKGAGAVERAAVASEAMTGLGAEAAAGITAEAGALAATEVTGVFTLGHLAAQFVPIVQAVVLAYGAVQLGRIVWKKSKKTNTWLRERKLRGLQQRLSERLDALYAGYEQLRDTHTANTAPFAPAHELLALCEFEEQRLRTLAGDLHGRTGGGDLGLLRDQLCDHAAQVSRGLAKGLATHLKQLIQETDAHLAAGDKARAALHLFLNKDLVFPPQVLEDLQTQEIAVLAAEVAGEVQRIESAG